MSWLSDLEEAGAPEEVLEAARKLSSSYNFDENRFTLQDDIVVDGIIYGVSTVYLFGIPHTSGSLDHLIYGLPEDDTPQYYETAVNIGGFDGKWVYRRRYPTEEAAREGHEEVKQQIQDGSLELQKGYLRDSTGSDFSFFELLHEMFSSTKEEDYTNMPASDDQLKELE